uniref:Leucine-rich repeat-containing N-terminal plant-type domain-containing protein n=1 Tax=Solanum lycopersicum TaxID=4081 RepID=K4AU67_SOLLC
MARKVAPDVAYMYNLYYTNSFIVTTKRLELELPRILTTNIIINLSNNRFEGHIPSIIGDLVGLRMLNLSHNRLEDDGLRGLPLSKDCGGDEWIRQATTRYGNWQEIVMGCGCGLVIGLSIIYIMFSNSISGMVFED